MRIEEAVYANAPEWTDSYINDNNEQRLFRRKTNENLHG